MMKRSVWLVCAMLLVLSPWACESTPSKQDGQHGDSHAGHETNGQESTADAIPDGSSQDQPRKDTASSDKASGETTSDAAPADGSDTDGNVSVPWPEGLNPDATPDSASGDITPAERLPSDVPPSPSQCQGKTAPSKKDDFLSMKHDGQTRRYRIHIPGSYDPAKPIPLIINMHGYTSDSWQQSLLSDMSKHADKHGYIVVYPEGTRLVKSWNAGKCCPPGGSNKADDVGFINALLDKLESDFCIDKRRIYATGMSNGGFMSHRLACQLSQRIAAFAPVAGHLVYEPCEPKRPVPIMHFHGTDDAIVPYKGSQVTGFPPVQESIDFWVKHNKCDAKPTRTFAKGDATCDTYSGCDAGVTVTLCTIHGGGHTWPGGLVIPAGKTSKDLKATDAMWTFFQTFPLR